MSEDMTMYYAPSLSSILFTRRNVRQYMALSILTLIFLLQAQPILPDSTITPGDTFPGAMENICRKGYTKEVRNVSKSDREKVFRLYKITHRKRGEYEVDHLIPLELGGSNDIKNLWPQSYWTEPWNAKKKDRLENRLKRLVCVGKLTLQQAQYEISHNWIESYKKRIEKQ